MNTTTKVLLLAGLGAAGYYVWKSKNSGGSSTNSGGLDPEAGADEKVVSCTTNGTSLLMHGHYPSQDRGAYSLLRAERLHRETAFLDTIPEATSCSRFDVRVIPTPLNFAKCVSTVNSFEKRLVPSLNIVPVYKAPTGLTTDISRETKTLPSGETYSLPRVVDLFEVVGIDGVTVHEDVIWLRLAQSKYWVEANNFVLVGNKSSNGKPQTTYTEKSNEFGLYRLLTNTNIYLAPSYESPIARIRGNAAIIHGYHYDPQAPPDAKAQINFLQINRVVYGSYCPLPEYKMANFLNDKGDKRLISCEWGEITISDPDKLQASIKGYIPLNLTYYSESDQV